MHTHLLLLCKYNLWANKRICNFIEEAGVVLADKEQTSSFPTIRKTLYHIWDAQVIWLSRLNEESMHSWPSHNFEGTLQDACRSLIENSEAFVRFAEKLSENDPTREITYHSLDKTAFKSTVEEIIMHVMNHGTFHRGQLITMLRGAGFEKLGSTDLIRFLRENKS
jgi:uncharacterized damage-inducible protein DinB